MTKHYDAKLKLILTEIAKKTKTKQAPIRTGGFERGRGYVHAHDHYAAFNKVPKLRCGSQAAVDRQQLRLAIRMIDLDKLTDRKATETRPRLQVIEWNHTYPASNYRIVQDWDIDEHAGQQAVIAYVASMIATHELHPI